MVLVNRLSERKISQLIKYHRQALSYRQIARKLKINRETVGRYIRRLKEPTRVIPIGLYVSDIKKLRREAKKQKKYTHDIVREIVHEHLNIRT